VSQVHEANAVMLQGDGHQFEIQLGHLCNNRCVFCASGQLTQMGYARPIPLEPILEALREARRGGATRVVFLGGEPTLHKGFIDALAQAKALGFEEIVIFTNGVRLPQKGFVDAIVALGSFTWRISIQGGNEAAHVAVTKRGQSFRKIVEGLEILRRHGQRVTTNICVNQESYRSLPDFPELIERYGIQELHLDIVRPASTGERTTEYLGEIIPRYTEMAPYYRRMLEGFEARLPGFDVNVGNLPYCVLPDWSHVIHHAGQNTLTLSAGRDALETTVDKYAIHRSQRVYLPGCPECVFYRRCTGVFREYLEIYGGDELQPVSIARLREIDPQERSFDLLLTPFLAPLLDSAAAGERLAVPPEGWTAAELFRDGRMRRVDLSYRRLGGGGVTFVLLPPRTAAPSPGAPEAVLETSRYRVGLRVDGWLEEADVLGIARWAVERLLTAPGLELLAPLDEAAVTRARGDSVLDSRARTRLARTIQRVQRRGRFGTWSYGGVSSRGDGRGARVHLRGPEGYQLDLVLESGVKAGRTQLTAAFELAAGTPERVARPVIEAVVATLEG
jgi:MoaA/NifB/PqqE/SkfB family radical SAM enzyme